MNLDYEIERMSVSSDFQTDWYRFRATVRKSDESLFDVVISIHKNHGLEPADPCVYLTRPVLVSIKMKGPTLRPRDMQEKFSNLSRKLNFRYMQILKQFHNHFERTFSAEKNSIEVVPETTHTISDGTVIVRYEISVELDSFTRARAFSDEYARFFDEHFA